MGKQLLVGLVAKARSGKDTVADRLVNKHNFYKGSFAIPVKEFAIRHFGLTPEELYGNKTEKSRWIIQAIGNGCREEFGKDIWVEKLLKTIAGVETVVISDVRYINEANCIKARGGYIIKIERPDAPQIEYGADHPSEMEMGSIIPNFSLHNDGSLHQLYTRVDGIVSCIKDRGIRCNKRD